MQNSGSVTLKGMCSLPGLYTDFQKKKQTPKRRPLKKMWGKTMALFSQSFGLSPWKGGEPGLIPRAQSCLCVSAHLAGCVHSTRGAIQGVSEEFYSCRLYKRKS